jgi:hypothetical protein
MMVGKRGSGEAGKSQSREARAILCFFTSLPPRFPASPRIIFR